MSVRFKAENMFEKALTNICSCSILVLLNRTDVHERIFALCGSLTVEYQKKYSQVA